MSTDWPRLIQLRERQKLAAQQAVAQEREALQHRMGQLAQAHQVLGERQQHKQQLWQAQRAGGPIAVEQLRHASAYSRTLDRGIAEAAAGVGQAQQACRAQAGRLEQSRATLRSACADVQKAERMHERERAAARRLRAMRQDDAADEAALQAWGGGAGRTGRAG